MALADLDTDIQAVPPVAEEERFCGKHDCGAPVGRSIDGHPPRDEGYCDQCGSRFSFRPTLEPGVVVADRYEVRRCIARGGLGYVYRAYDTRLGQQVALKGLIDVNNTAAARIAENESQVLVALGHPNIVRILDVVKYEDASYIVMEFVNGLPLREVKNRGQASLDPVRNGLLVEHVVGYGREILTALSYLHGQGLLYCDMKPDNVIHGGRRVKLIDFGAIRRIGDQTSPWIFTEHYQVGKEELITHGLTVRSDIHTVGKTLWELFEVSDGRHWGSSDKPVGREHIAAFGIESLEYVLKRAIAPFERRFASAEEMLVQLDGVLNEILSLRDGRPRPTVSTLFTEPVALLDAGLGDAPPLSDWTNSEPVSLLRRPTPREIAVALPAPRDDPEDPQLPFLRSVRASDPARLLRKLEQAGPSVEVEFRRCRALLELGDAQRAAACVRRAVGILGRRAAHDWRVRWHEALVALASGHVKLASSKFAEVRADIAGEETPKLALGLCAEHLGGDAERFYRALWLHRSQVNAAFGLVRVALARGDRAGAVGVLDEVPEFSRHDEAARIACIRARTGRLTLDGLEVPPAAGDFADADERLSVLDADATRVARLRASVLETALICVGRVDLPAGPLLGEPPTERALRGRLEKTLRELAWQAESRAEHAMLTDLANKRRPLTLL
ncbi:serine/threonine-protein kinase [Actinokineospora sp. UTMC 2448]|uniref:serine/threonine-protein kinase n=1 Tax=Actinokineospora sp. UTMC 2448 TaxID=2268449 RepID=UPI002164275E|nr:serine/threonine-protein kinase [Actinokineospora sp. UTMC 2448]